MEINGKKVVDATKSLHITISKEDAVRGKNKNPSACAAALAVLRCYKKEGVKGTRVHLGRTYVEYPDKWVRYRTPNSLKTEIVSFDRGAKAQFMEGNYTLEKISATQRLGVRKKAPGNDSRTRSKRPKIARAVHQIEGVRAKGANK